MENKIDINSLIGFFLIGLIFIGWLYLNPPPETTENIQTDDVEVNAEYVTDSVNKSLKPDLSQVLLESNISENEETALSFENSLSEKLKKNPQMTCVVGLSTEPERLADLRKNRMNSLRETENIKYTDLENIKKEVLDAKKTFQKYKWPLIDVTRKSVEETAASIIKIHEIYLNNAK